MTRHLLAAMLLSAIGGTSVLGGCQDSSRPRTEDEGDSAPAAPGMAELMEVTRIDGNEHVLDVIAVPHAKRGVAVAQDGTIAIKQIHDLTVRLFDRDGRPIGTVGRSGDGPGEFEGLTRVAWSGDTLWVLDNRQRRATALSRSGEYLRSFRYGSTAQAGTVDGETLSPGTLFSPLDISADAEPSLFVRAASPPPPSRLLRITPERGVERTIALLPNAEDEYAGGPFPTGDWEYDLSRPAGRAAQAQASVEGANAGTFEVTAVDLEGDTVFSRRLPFEAVGIPGHVRDSVIDARVEGLRSLPVPAEASDQIEARVRELRSAPIPPAFPPLQELVVGDDASIWVEMRARSDGQPYVVLDAAGNHRGTALLPPRSQVAVARLNRIWAVEMDEFDIPSLVVYEVAWR